MPELILYRDASLEGVFTDEERAVSLYLGRERRPRPSSFFRDILHNRRYYERVESTLRALKIKELTIFLEGEPLERFIFDKKLAQSFNLWEDGLSHYVDLTSDTYYAARGLAQIICGFYPRGALARRADRNQFKVYDRFERKNLKWKYPNPATEYRNEILVVGSPLVEDRLISQQSFLQGLELIAAASPTPLRYLAHPREDRLRLLRDLAQFPTMTLDNDMRGVMAHVSSYGYIAYLSGLSTALLDIGRNSSSIFVPALFRLKRPAKALGGWTSSPVKCADTQEQLRDYLRHLADRVIN